MGFFSRIHRPAALVACAVCLGIVVYGSAHPSTWVWSPPQWDFTPAPLPYEPEDMPTPPPLEPSEETPVSQVWLWIFRAMGIAIAAGILALVAWVIYRAVKALLTARVDAVPDTDRLPTGANMTGIALTPAEITDAVEEALRRIDQAETSTDAVIMAWLSFEEAASRHGMKRDPAQTPTEFTSALLENSPVPATETATLRTLYLRTRFSGQPADSGDVNQARRSLETIARSLEARA